MRHESCTVVALVAASLPGVGGPREGSEGGSPGASSPGASPPGAGPSRPGPGQGSARAGRPGSGADGARAGRGSAAADPASILPGRAGPPAPLAEPLLAELNSSANVSVVRPPAPGGDAVESAALALGQAARRSSAFALVPADPLAAVAAEWEAMWDLSRGGLAGGVLFDEQAAHALAAWRARQFELPDYYLVLTAAGHGAGAAVPDFYLGPLRAVRPHRVVAVAAAEGPEQAAGVRTALRSLRPGPWWPPLDELLDTTRRFFAGGLAEAGASLATAPR